MKRLLATLGLVVAAPFGAAMAADMPLKAPPIVAEYNWTGMYAGLNAGWLRNDFDWRYTNPAPVTCCAPFSASVTDGIAGVHGGIQWQWSHIVFGVEVAGDALAQSSWASGGNWATGAGCVAPNSLTTACQARIPGFMTAGGRLGWAWGDWLVFGSGGWAITDVKTRLVNPAPGGLPGQVTFDHSGARHDGWYVGFGVEHVVYKGSWADLIIGAEYQHLDFGSQLELSSLDGFAPCPPGVNCRVVSATDDIVRVRVTAKINSIFGFR
jgi:outer membrane immunogenic protein